VLDKTVPGWATLVDVLGPALPFIPAITAILGATAGIAPELVGAAFQTVQTTANVADTLTGLPTSQASQILRPLDTFTQNTVAQAVNYAAQVGTTNANAVAQVQASLLKAVSTAAYTRGTALQKFEAAGVEAANGVILALQVAAAVLPGGQAAGPALQALALALKATITAATASGDAGQIAEAVGFVIAKGLPAILVGVGDVALTATGVASTVVTVGGDTTVATDAATGFTTTTTIDPLFSTTLGTLVRGIASVEATAISTSASVAQVYLAAQRLKDATDAANRAAVAKAQALDAQTVALQQKLVVLQKNAPARAAASGAPASLAPLAFGALVLALIARGR
jgi:hypothetical protein